MATVDGDSIVVTYRGTFPQDTLRFVFRRASLPARVIPDAKYRLSWVNGRTGEPLVVRDSTTEEGHRVISVVMFDTLQFSDGIFVRRHRWEADTTYWAGSPAVYSAREWTTWGAVESGPGWARLLYYDSSATDSIGIRGDTLVRRAALINGVLEERYTR